MDRTVKIGIIGCGGIANGKHMPSLKKIKNAQMVAFCDIIEERAVKAAEEYGVEGAKVYTDYKELLKDKDIEVVHVCTPNRSHAFISIDAMEAGKHVMCEKPMAKTYKEAKEMLDTSERTGMKLTIGYQSRWIRSISKKCVRTASLAKYITARLLRFADVLFRHGAFSSTNTSRAAVRSLISAPMRSILPFG